jgi:CPA2 family monovalent cation:H+ antiporter-2
LIGKTIREADISDSIIIGIERSTVNIMNPDPDTIFKENDTVWIVGKRKIIKGLNKD